MDVDTKMRTIAYSCAKYTARPDSCAKYTARSCAKYTARADSAGEAQ